jgi:putative RecB family exonuclease
MAYPISTTKLVTYQTCSQAYYLRYERGIDSLPKHASPNLGNALHKALAMAYRDWHYNDYKPGWDWFDSCWNLCLEKLSEKQIQKGRADLEGYYLDFVAPLTVMERPLGVESQVKATVQFENIEFLLTGRYDRLDYVTDGLHLLEFKSGKNASTTHLVDLRLGLYSMALQQRYQQALKRLTLVFLGSRETLSFEVNDSHRQQVKALIANLALKLRSDDKWAPNPGDH